MAKIVLGLGSSHAPQLRLTPDEWYKRANFDHRNPEMWYRGKTYTFPELVEERGAEHFERELDPAKAQARFDSCQRAIARLSDSLARAAPDVVVIFGDDQHESFDDDNMPAISVYWGQTVDDAPTPTEGVQHWEAQGATGGAFENAPKQRMSHPTIMRNRCYTSSETYINTPCRVGQAGLVGLVWRVGRTGQAVRISFAPLSPSSSIEISRILNF